MELVEENTNFEKEVEAMQELINTGECWKLEGSFGRRAMELIKEGYCMLGEQGCHDYYGNYIPSRYEVITGTMGSVEYCQAMYDDQ